MTKQTRTTTPRRVGATTTITTTTKKRPLLLLSLRSLSVYTADHQSNGLAYYTDTDCFYLHVLRCFLARKIGDPVVIYSHRSLPHMSTMTLQPQRDFRQLVMTTSSITRFVLVQLDMSF